MEQNWYFNPIIFELGPFKAHWYGLMYAIAFICGYLYIHYSKPGKKLNLSAKEKDSLVLTAILGVLLGGRLGYILFYNLPYYLQNPLKMITVWEGGMSFHGGLIGVAIGLFWAMRKKIQNFLPVTDIITSIAPLGLFFGRLGNFINGELYGRIASSFCLYFPGDPLNCRYPSQLIQAGLEGLLLFTILQYVIHKSKKAGTTSGYFLIFYGIFRTIAEFFREPDAQIGFLPGGITEGQLLSSFMVICGILLLVWIYKSGKSKTNKPSHER